MALIGVKAAGQSASIEALYKYFLNDSSRPISDELLVGRGRLQVALPATRTDAPFRQCVEW